MSDLLPAEILKSLWPHGDQHVPGLVEGIIASAPTVFAKYGISNSLEVAHIMAQASEECGAGLELVENDNFTAEQLVKLWPAHFTGSMAERYAHNPRMICDVAYGGRMGNAPPPSDDGYNYRGQGILQLTGKNNYEALAKITGLDVVAEPSLLTAPATALECCVADFVKICGALPAAQADQVVEVTRKVNGGLNGLAVREQWLARWKAALAAPLPAAAPAPAPAPPSAAPAPQPKVEDLWDQLRSVIEQLRARA